MFDKLYVLAKGGICVYSGLPQDLSSHLRECDIVCNEFEIPVEILLKLSSKGLIDPNIVKLAEKTSVIKESVMERCKEEKLLISDGIPLKTKKFSLNDLKSLLLRNITYTVRYQWKALVFEFLFYQFCGYAFKNLHNDNIDDPTGCMSFTNSTVCHQSIEKMEEKFLVGQNLRFNMSIILVVLIIQAATSTLTFATEVKIFLNEHRNGML
jgi:hypothetical protein